MTNITWESILEEHTKVPSIPRESLLLLGSPKTGKSTFLHKAFQTNPTTRNMLSYNFYTHRDKDSDELQIELSIYSLSKDIPINRELLSNYLNMSTLNLIFLDWENPAEFLSGISFWLEFLLNCVDKTLKKKNSCSSTSTVFDEGDSKDSAFQDCKSDLNNAKKQLREVMQHFKVSQSRDWQPDSTLENVPINKGCLEVNLGIPIVFVLSKSDLANAAAEELELNSFKIDLILQSLRKVALTIGAGIFSLNVNSDTSVNDLVNYILYRACPKNFPNETQVNALDISSLKIPSGWDSLDKIGSITAASNLDESFLIELEYSKNSHSVNITGKSYYKKQFPNSMDEIENNFDLKTRSFKDFLSELEAAQPLQVSNIEVTAKDDEKSSQLVDATPKADELNDFFQGLLNKKK